MEDIGTRIKRRRRVLGMSLNHLAEEVGRTHTWVVDVERGRTVPKDTRLIIRIADAVGLDRVELVALAIRERSREFGDPPSWECTRELFTKLSEVMVQQASKPVEIEKTAPRSYRMIESIAEGMADRLYKNSHIDAGFGPPVVDLCGDLSAFQEPDGPPLDFAVYDDRNEEGMTYSEDGTVVVAVNDDVWERAQKGDGRSRWTLGHELGHARLHHCELMQGATAFRDQYCTPSERLADGVRIFESPEWQANVFAACFLMPTNAVRNYIHSTGDWCTNHDIARHFQVSVSAASNRMSRILPKLVKGGEV